MGGAEARAAAPGEAATAVLPFLLFLPSDRPGRYSDGPFGAAGRGRAPVHRPGSGPVTIGSRPEPTP
ncbi:hypothetical protein SLITK23_27700 [Streptomyces lividans]|nr:hypothetical protein SLITK23_27700 [Streptomyces lividans]GHA46411.1 hypothetical protein GCM10010391_33360 [Streptomyces anthocyanicus]